MHELTGMHSNYNAVKDYWEFVHRILPWRELRNIQWMNQKASPKEAYVPTNAEHIANVITHGIWIVPSILATSELYSRSRTGAQLISAVIYGATLVFLFSISTSFHCVCYRNNHGQLKGMLHRADRAMIYIFIAGSYFPWLAIQPPPSQSWASSMKWFVWLLASLGIIYQQAFHEKYKMLETIFYLFMGIFPFPFITLEEIKGISEIKIGGVLYIFGVFFFKMDGSIPCAHAIWHLFVVIAAAIHYFAILNYLYPLGDS